MRFIVEFDGVVVDVRGTQYALYRDVAAEVGWSRVDEATYWRAVRRHGGEADVLPGARPAMRKEYLKRFGERLEEADWIAKYPAQADVDRQLTQLARHGPCVFVTSGSNLTARRDWLAHSGWAPLVDRMEKLSDDPRRRGGELRALAEGDPRTVVVAADDPVIRAAGNAEFFSVGISSGACSRERLHQAGADVVYARLGELIASLESGAQELIRAGLLPASLG